MSHVTGVYGACVNPGTDNKKSGAWTGYGHAPGITPVIATCPDTTPLRWQPQDQFMAFRDHLHDITFYYPSKDTESICGAVSKPTGDTYPLIATDHNRFVSWVQNVPYYQAAGGNTIFHLPYVDGSSSSPYAPPPCDCPSPPCHVVCHGGKQVCL
jgi:hypothetical protein